MEIYEDPKTKKIFAECGVCEAQGALADDPRKARTNLLKIKSTRPSRQGGARTGAGRTRRLHPSAKPHAYVLCDSHVAKIEKFMLQWKKSTGEELKGLSAGLRMFLDNVKVKDLKEFCTR
jgi:hypothetical protein